MDFQDIANKDTMQIAKAIDGVNAATATNYGLFFTAPFACEVVEVTEVHQTAGTDVGAVTLQLEKLTATQALDAGVNLLASAIDLKGTINTTVYPTLTATKTDRILKRGDRLALKDSGVLTSVAGICVTVRIKPIHKGHYL